MAQTSPALPHPFHSDQRLLAKQIERFFRDITEKRLRRGVFHSVPDLIEAIEAYVAAYNQSPTPFIWTAEAADILAKVTRARQKLQTLRQ